MSGIRTVEKNAIALERECGRDLVGPHTNISRAQDSHRGWFYGYGFSDGEPRICLKDDMRTSLQTHRVVGMDFASPKQQLVT